MFRKHQRITMVVAVYSQMRNKVLTLYIWVPIFLYNQNMEHINLYNKKLLKYPPIMTNVNILIIIIIYYDKLKYFNNINYY